MAILIANKLHQIVSFSRAPSFLFVSFLSLLPVKKKTKLDDIKKTRHNMSTFQPKREPGDHEKENEAKNACGICLIFIDKLPDKNLTKIHASSGVNEW